MPRLPGREALTRAPDANSRRHIATQNLAPFVEAQGAMGQQMQRLGQNLITVGARADRAARADAERTNRYNAEKAFQEFRWSEIKGQEEHLRGVEPGEVDGLADTWSKGYRDRAKSFLANVSPDLKETYDQKLFAVERSLYGHALTFQRGEQRRSANAEIDDHENNVVMPQAGASARTGGELSARNTRLKAIIAEGEKVIESNPNLSEIEKEARKRQLRANAERAWLGALHPRERIAALRPGGDSVVDRIVQIESGGRANAKNPKSTATGAGQFIERTWLDMIDRYRPELAEGKTRAEILALRTDPALSREMTARYASENAQYLESRGVSATPAATYLAHFLGPGGAVAVLRADSGTSVDVLLEKGVINANAGILKGKTAGQIAAWAERRMSGASGGMVSSLPYAERQKLISAADRELNVERKEYVDNANDYISFLTDGGEPTGGYSPDANSAMLGERAAAELDEKIARAEAFGKKVRDVRYATPDELKAMASKSVKSLDDPENYKTNKAEAEALARAVSQRNSALVKDPAQFVLGTEQMPGNPRVVAAYENMTEALTDNGGPRNIATADLGTLASRYATLTLAEQERLGLKPEQQRILTAELNAAIVEQFKDQSEGGQNAAQLMRQLASQWGKHWPKVVKELSNDMPLGLMIVSNMDARGQELAAEQLAEALNIGDKVLKEAVGDENAKAIREGVSTAVMSELAASMPPTNGGLTTRLAVEDATEALAMLYMTRGEKDPEAAVSRAYENIISKKYMFINPNIRGLPGMRSFSDRLVRVPNHLQGRAIERGAAIYLGAFLDEREDDVRGGMKIDFPNLVLPRNPSGLDEESLRIAYQKHLKENGYWVTGPNEEGLVLYDAQTQKPVEFEVDGERVPFLTTWETLSDAAFHPDLFRDEQTLKNLRDLPPVDVGGPSP